MSINKIKAHFLPLGYKLSIKAATSPFNKGKHVLECPEDVASNRFPKLLEYFFGSSPEACSFNAFLVKLDDFNADGHGITDICRKCGCTERDACYDERTGTGCWWAEPDLCSACATQKEINAAVAEMRNLSEDN